MLLLDQLAEARIREAAERGELSNLAGEGKPLDLSEEPLVDPSLAAMNRVLKNAGFLPPHVQQLADLEEAMRALDTHNCADARRRQRLLMRTRIEQIASGNTNRAVLASWLHSWTTRLRKADSNEISLS